MTFDPVPPPPNWKPRVFPRIGGYGPPDSEAASRASHVAKQLCRHCPPDVHGHVECFVVEDGARLHVIVSLIAGPARTLWQYAAICEPWQVATDFCDAVLAVWAPERQAVA